VVWKISCFISAGGIYSVISTLITVLHSPFFLVDVVFFFLSIALNNKCHARRKHKKGGDLFNFRFFLFFFNSSFKFVHSCFIFHPLWFCYDVNHLFFCIVKRILLHSLFVVQGKSRSKFSCASISLVCLFTLFIIISKAKRLDVM
jgi:hypothetical protein